ncbi:MULTISPECIES: type I-F CRISPR-associated helicase Cas3f [unclassified Halomonas]|uniref:type I-F CRISPR-associated helicase Cas3f n=1 Tax=unclassified Halomonas TaxID=2609666 RepID=UPI0028885A5F|nr:MULTISPECIES: type I-F CRISPR-associated helicase Cas3f [unclassified Halomonas]MDT0499972.1 type I-F CRISPR-associated helicase Cas3f [Halomonas sp. PAR7]MDT0512376.1 type I-F CRISPR-associated helicase Cas3f [Halomonas sp. LES1]MDT0591010.1 type I-F CRISPR-associated helicase Cas3f [Halomonas sp. PAR8]
MNVLIVSQCNKNALKETRRILDQFAERRGERTWQTAITQAGLDTLRKLLRKTARKNSAVACHWIRGHDHSELVWIVGDASRFNLQGATPTNTTRRNILRAEDENDWHSGEDIKLLASLAALLHDLGKASEAFQQRLVGKRQGRNLYRHEWLSLRLFQAFVGSDDDAGWLQRLIEPPADFVASWTRDLQRDGLDAESATPFQQLPPLAQAIGWLLLSHHRLPLKPGNNPERLGGRLTGLTADALRELPELLTHQWNEACTETDDQAQKPYWQLAGKLPVATIKWQQQAADIAEGLLKRLPHYAEPPLDNGYVMHLARLCLMLADHYYSSLHDPTHSDWVRGDSDYTLYANTLRKTGELSQKLDAHLLGVARFSKQNARHLATLNDQLPRLARHKGFRKRSENKRFRWQDRAFDLAEGLRAASREQGFFGTNMASTGCGKTLANGRILYALADPEKGARFSIALGLRTLTLQTGRDYRRQMHLGEDELAIRVGGSASRALFEHYEAQAEQTGSASAQELLSDDSHVLFEGNFSEHPILRRVAHDPAVKSLLAAPILTCTVDHLMPATESTRGGGQIAPMLRLMTSDLVLDEIDDFDISDLPALTRLVNWAGLLGSRVLLSSATLPPALVAGLFDAYLAGRAIYQRNRGESGQRAPAVCCAWFDENGTLDEPCCDRASFEAAHRQFVQQRHLRLAKDTVRRRARVADWIPQSRQSDALRHELAEHLRDHALELHRQNGTALESGKRVSFGLIRMANIAPLVAVAQALYRLGAPEHVQIHLCVYHSQYPLLMRSAIERQLDQTLQRKSPEAVFVLPEIRRCLESSDAEEQLFIVLGSPVTEVGRDHDYDWAIVEPSSMRSLIQLAGRVRRHRPEPWETPNILLLNHNLKALEHPDGRRPVFTRPGFETEAYRLHSHALAEVLTAEQRDVIDARPRILPRDSLAPHHNLVDLEHTRLEATMIVPDAADTQAMPVLSEDELAKLSKRKRQQYLAARDEPAPAPKLGAYSWFAMPRLPLTGVMCQWRPFRDSTDKEDELVLLPDESGERTCLHRVHKERPRDPELLVPCEASLQHIELQYGPRIQSWGPRDYLETLAELAEAQEMELERCARKFGRLTLRALKDDGQWQFHPALGFSKH